MEPIADIASSLGPDGLPATAALRIGELAPEEIYGLFGLTSRLRRERAGATVHLCAIVNAKSGRCSEDCRFCAQSAHWRTAAPVHPLLPAARIAEAAARAKNLGAREFGIVTAGKGIETEEEIAEMEAAIRAVAGHGIHPCASPGMVADAALERWRAAGLYRYHHNLETARSFFGAVCTTHDYEEDVAAIKRARAAGLPVCSGGLFGLGESFAQRVELGLTLRELEVDSAPLNFFIPAPGTPLAETAPGIAPLECLRVVVLFRLLLPRARVIVCGGREHNLRSLQPLIFAAGADGMMIGDLLTTIGRPPEDDLRMLADLGLEPAP